jgi:hypothetical protein
MKEYPKTIKRMIRDFSAMAYERELHRELTILDQSFDEWREGKLGSGELNVLLHEYETGPARELFRQYNAGFPDINVAYAIVGGTLNRDEIPPELLEALADKISTFEAMKARGELRMPGEPDQREIQL